MDLDAKRDERTEVTALVERAMRGDDSVWGEVYEKTRRYVYFIALKSLHNEQDAQDIVHDVYIQVIRSIGQLYSPDSFYGWLRRIIFSKCTDFVKKKKPSLIDDSDMLLEEIPEIEESFLPDMVLDSAEARRMVMDLVDALPDAQRQSVLFYYFDEMTVDQISALMECSAGTVKSRLNYARSKIKSGVEEYKRKGIKLYGVAALPILTILLREQAQAMELPPALGAGLAPILNGASSTIGTTAASGTTVTKAAFTLSSKFIAGIIAVVIAIGGGITAWVLTRENQPIENHPIVNVPSINANEQQNEEEHETQTEPAEASNPAQGNYAVPEAITAFLDNLFDAFYAGDMSLVYSLMNDENLRLWFSSLDHMNEIFYTAESGQATTRAWEYGDDDYSYRDRLNYNKSAGAAKPHFGIEFVQSRSDAGQITIMVQYGKRENGFTYHMANIHYYGSEVIQFDWDDLTYQDGKATGAFKRYMFQPGDGGIFSNSWQVQSGNTVDGFYEGDVIEERHNVYDGAEVQVYTWLLKYADGLLQPLGEADAEGKVPYASFVSESSGALNSVQPEARPPDDPEWGIKRPYTGIGLG